MNRNWFRALALVAAALLAGCATIQSAAPMQSSSTSEHRFEKSYTLGQEQTAYVGQPIAKVKDYWEATITADVLSADRSASLKLPPFIRIQIAQGSPAHLIGTTTRDGHTYRVVTLPYQQASALRFLLNDDGTLQGSAINFMGERMGFSYTPEPADLHYLAETRTELDSKRGFTNFELVYSGATKDTLNLLYREYTPEDMARPAFTQNLTYDRASPSIRFRELQLRVLEASNERLRYVVEADGLPAD